MTCGPTGLRLLMKSNPQLKPLTSLLNLHLSASGARSNPAHTMYKVQLDPNTKGPTKATLEGLPPKVMRAIKEVDWVARKMLKGFTAVRFNNGYEVRFSGDHDMFVAQCLLVYDLEDRDARR